MRYSTAQAWFIETAGAPRFKPCAYGTVRRSSMRSTSHLAFSTFASSKSLHHTHIRTKDQEPPRRQVYIDEVQERLLQLHNGLDYGKFLNALVEAEQSHGPSPDTSRLQTDQTHDWKETTLFLILTLKREVLHAVLDNTFPRRALPGGGGDLIRTLRFAENITVNAKADHDPVVYIQWLANKERGGLTIPNYERFLNALSVAARLEDDPGQQFAKRVRTVLGNDRLIPLRDNIQQIYAEVSNKRPTTVSFVYTSAVQEEAREFIRVNRQHVIPRARQRNDTEILLRGEVGWTFNPGTRLNQHRMLTLTGKLYALANCVLRHLFPRDGFKLHQYILFEVNHPDHASIGEAVGTQLAAGYIKHGGFNIRQSGINVQSWNEEYKWLKWIESGLFDKLQENIDLWGQSVKRKLIETKEQIQRHEAHAAALKTAELVKQLEGQLKVNNEIAEIVKAKISKITLFREKLKKEAADREVANKAYQKFLEEF